MIAADVRSLLARLLPGRIEFDVPLARHTALRIGGPADALATPLDRDELRRLLALCAAHEVATTVLGAGFNVLVREGGIRGVVIRLKKLRRIERVARDAISVEAGASHATMTRYCVDKGLTGLEFGAGIPGTLGGWLAMNAGIGTREMKDVVREVELLDRAGQGFARKRRDELDFRYRALSGLPPGTLVVAAVLEVEPSTRDRVQAEIDRLVARRQATQPLDLPSCGSVFRNPPDDHAGRLIEAAGLKGERQGAAEISMRHANFIVNHGGARESDVLTLIERARTAVEAMAGIRLETEVRLLGEPLDAMPSTEGKGAMP